MKHITIIGGGVAGLSLAIGLRRRGIPVTVFEAGAYPRHRVCGEFISGQGLKALRVLGLEAALDKAGAITANTAVFCTHGYRSGSRRLPRPARCISRWTLDDCLRRLVEESGGTVHQSSRWAGPTDEPGVVFASGRRVQAVDHGKRWVGLKVHAQVCSLEADLEMHVFENQYIGLCKIDGNRVNICGLFRLPAEGRRPLSSDLLRGPVGSPLRERLAAVPFDAESFCAVAGLSLRPTHQLPSPCLRIGDVLTMIPPVTGNGMSMALESALLAIEPLAAFSEGRTRWHEVMWAVQGKCRKAFNRRLFWAGLLQRLLFTPVIHSRAPCLFVTCPPVWRALFHATR